jgi:hypothetical protein
MKMVDKESGLLTDAGAMQALLDGKVIRRVSKLTVYSSSPYIEFRIRKKTGQVINELGDPCDPLFGWAGVRWKSLRSFSKAAKKHSE